jgi:hypothetical protein
MPMTLQQRIQAAGQSVVQPYSFVSPVKGWNTRDALDVMDPADAIQLDNLYPDAGGVSIRNGYVLYASGLGAGTVKTLVEYDAGPARKFLAGASGAIYDVSASGAVGAPLASGFGNDAWQTVNFLSRTFFCNGTDTMQVYNGSTVANAAFTGGSTPALNTLIGAALYQQRLFFWQNNSTGFWFAQLNSISGTLSFFDLSAYTPRGGNLIAMTTYSLDGGNGVQDFVVFVMSSGDCLIYFGNDPSDLLNWALVGIYALSPPVGPRAVCNYGAEAFLTTYDDHVPLKLQLTAISAGGLPARSKVSNAVQAAVAANKGAFGWQALYYPKGRRLIFNIPNPDGSFSQHIQNTGVQYGDKQTNQMASPWCRFVNMPASCWGLFKDSLYFGAPAGSIYLADTGNMDLLGPVTAIGQQAWNDLGSPLRKRATAIRPVLQTIGSLGYTFSIGFDYGDVNVPVSLVTSNPGSPWDTSPWDTSPWSAEQVVNTLWSASGGSGVALSVALNISATQPATWLRTDLRGETGTGF